MDDDREIIFIPEGQESPIKIFFENLWNDIVFKSTMIFFSIIGVLYYFITLGGVEIEVGYEENGENKNYLYLEKLW